MKVGLEGKVALVTGAASGIGKAAALQIAASGADGLILTDRDQDGCAATASLVAATGVPVTHFVADLSDTGAPARILSAARDAFGCVDALVNAAGLTDRASLEDGSPDTWDRLFAVNARAPFLLMQGVVSDMKARRAAGSIVNILSVNAHCGTPELAAYAASKGALQTMTRNAAHACLPDQIRVNGLNLGWVLTESEHRMQAEVLGKGENWARDVASRMPLGRLLVPEEVARHVLFLLSDASAPMTGVALDLDQHVLGAPPRI